MLLLLLVSPRRLLVPLLQSLPCLDSVMLHLQLPQHEARSPNCLCMSQRHLPLLKCFAATDIYMPWVPVGALVSPKQELKPTLEKFKPMPVLVTTLPGRYFEQRQVRAAVIQCV